MTSRPYRPVGTIPTNAHYEKTSFQRFLSDPPRSFFKKLIVSTPRLLRNLHMMSQGKAAPDGLKDCECKKMVLRERPPIPYVPEKDSVQETVSSFKEAHLKTLIKEGTEPRVPARHSGTREAFLTLMRSAQKAIGRKGVLGPHTRNLPNLMRVALRSRNSSEPMVEASTECSTTLGFQRFSR